MQIIFIIYLKMVFYFLCLVKVKYDWLIVDNTQNTQSNVFTAPMTKLNNKQPPQWELHIPGDKKGFLTLKLELIAFLLFF